MKIFDNKISALDPLWWIVTICLIGVSIIDFTFWPIVGWIIFNAIVIPICFWDNKKKLDAEAEHEYRMKYHRDKRFK